MSLAEQAVTLFGIDLSPEQVAAFEIYAQELIAWNSHTNLTAITARDEIDVRHFLDSLSLVRAVPMTTGMRLIDVGSGAGFPGLPLAIALPELDVTLLEATGKKVAFLEHVIQMIHLPNVAALKARAEDAGHDSTQRAGYDVVMARAVARLPSLLEYLLPLAKVGGVCVAMKGKTAEEEAASSRQALTILGGVLRRIETVQLPARDEPHYLIIIEKIAPTPAEFPRKPGIPTRKPL